MNVLGIEKVDYVSKKTNNRVIGYNIYCSQPINNNYGFGSKVEKFYVSENVATKYNVNIFSEQILLSEIDFSYNRYGNITEIIFID